MLVCTDVFARGLDIPGVDVVVHYDFPVSAVRYVHRAGRTARAGRGGLSLVMVTERDVGMFERLERGLGRRMGKREGGGEERVLRVMDTVTQALWEAEGIVRREYPVGGGGGGRDKGGGGDEVDA